MLTLQDQYRILLHLNLPLSRLEEVQSKVDLVNRSEFLSQNVLNLLSELDSLVGTIAEERSSTSYALTKADVVEWEPGKRTSGMEIQQKQCRQQLSQILEIQIHQRRLAGTLSISTEVIP